ncbi:MAG TPA: iron-containing redox enzyme family protein [Candidatus Acidoferrales bacterium]|nr:iron-containing redox enzyme family protein [Candidatus Acidoferrales bacterium]
MAQNADRLIEELMNARPPRHKERAVRALIVKGALSKDQVRMWVKQLHYYRVNVPRKELFILANCPIKEVRMARIKKYLDEEDDRVIGGTVGPHAELWLRLGEGLGIPREEMEDFRDLCPEYRLLVDSWLNYAREHSWLEGAAMSFDEDGGTGRTGEGMKLAEALATIYQVPEWALGHFRLHAELDVEHGSSTRDLIRKYAVTEEQQEAVRRAVRFKRAFHRLEDQCMRIACRIDPKLFAE